MGDACSNAGTDAVRADRNERLLVRVAREVANTGVAHCAVACSGGPDSTALVLAAASAIERGWMRPVVVVHVDHRTRPESAGEGQIVAEMCEGVGLPCVCTVVRSEPAGVGESPEARLRRLRYATLARTVSALGLDAVLTGHTLDDQVETILMRLLIGSGPAAVAGMRRDSVIPTEGGTLRIVRPLLGMRRVEILEIVHRSRIDPIDDPTNSDLAIRRNAVRRRIIPSIAEIFPGFEVALLRSTQLARDDGEYLDDVAKRTIEDVVTRTNRVSSLDRNWLRTAPTPISSRVVRAVVTELIDEDDARELTLERTNALLLAAHGRSGAVIQFPGGVTATVAHDDIRFVKESAAQ
jgi:tRNA(Ile)-lysidine synthase